MSTMADRGGYLGSGGAVSDRITQGLIVDLFAGPGGWDYGISHYLGMTNVVGLEWEPHACQTRAAAGLRTIRCDVAKYPTTPFIGKTWGLIASPPCQAFSSAGNGLGKKDLHKLYRHAYACNDGWVDIPDTVEWADERSPLVLQPLRWAWALQPEWVALEQVPPCLPMWETFEAIFGDWGYDTWSGVLEAERYGVPQTRERAVLIASRTRSAQPPEPTHQRYVKGEPQGHGCDNLFGGVKPWISMADALRWAETDAYHKTRGAGMTERHGDREDTPATQPAPTITTRWNREWRVRTGVNTEQQRGATPTPYERSCEDPAPTMTGKSFTQWTLRMGNQPNSAERCLDEPAPTVLFGHRANDNRWINHRPATMIVGSFGHDVVAAPGYRTEVSRQNAEGSVKISLSEALILQGFPPDYPVAGFKSKQGEQVGNAVPPPLAAHVISTAAGVPFMQKVAA